MQSIRLAAVYSAISTTGEGRRASAESKDHRSGKAILGTVLFTGEEDQRDVVLQLREDIPDIGHQILIDVRYGTDLHDAHIVRGCGKISHLPHTEPKSGKTIQRITLCAIDHSFDST